MLRSGAYNIAGGIARVVLALLTIPLLIRLVGLEEYGVWSLVSATLALLGVVEGGLAVSTTVFAAKDIARADWEGLAGTLTFTFGGMLLLATLAAAGLYIAARPVSRVFVHLSAAELQAVTTALKISSLVLWTRLVQQVFVGVEQAYQRYGLLNLIVVAQSIFGSLGLLALAWYGGRTVEFMCWQAVVSTGALLVHAGVVVRLLRPRRLVPRWDLSRILAVGRFSLLSWASTVGGLLFSQCDRLIVGALLNTTAVGVYAAVTGVAIQINYLSSMPVQPLLPTISDLLARASATATHVWSRMKEALQVNALVALGLGASLFVCAPLACRILLPKAPSPETVALLRIASVVYSTYSLSAVGFFALLAMGEAGVCTAIVGTGAGLSLLLVAAGAGRWGLPGAVAGNAGYILTLGLTVLAMRRLRIPVSAWIRWLGVPLLWYAGALVVGVLLPDRLGWQVPCLLGLVLLLGLWFLRQYQPLVSRLLR